jgi:hypothetical protein
MVRPTNGPVENLYVPDCANGASTTASSRNIAAGRSDVKTPFGSISS